MKTGAKENTMSLKTRLDGRSEDNNCFQIKNVAGEEIAQEA